MTNKPTYEELETRLKELEQAQSENKQAEEELAQIFNMSLDMICVADINSANFIKVNTAFTEMLGYSEKELLGQPFFKFLHPDDLGATQTVVEQKLKLGSKVINFENRYRCKDGSYLWLSWVSHPNVKKGVTYAVARDITESKHVEAKLKRKKALLDATGRMAKVGGWELDVKTLDVSWTEETYRIHEVPFDYEPPLKEATHFFHPDDRPGLEHAIQRAMKHGDPYDMEVRFITARGNKLWTRTICSPQIENGEVVKLHGTFQDITDQKKSEQALAEEKERLLVTLRSIGDGVITTDIEGCVVLINKVAEKLTGWIQSDARGKSIKEVFNIINANTRKICENPVEKVLEAGTIVGLANHTNLISREGTERMIADSGAPIFDMNSQIVGVVLVFRDVTNAYKTEQKLQQAQKMDAIGVLAGGIAHDFNNLLGVVAGNVSYALSLTSSGYELYEVLTDVQNSAKQAQALTRQLLTFSKGGAPIKKVTDLNQIIEDASTFVSHGEKSRCEFELAKDLWGAEVDSGQISQVISNLVINANQSMPEGGVIRVGTENYQSDADNAVPLDAGKYVRIVIQDQGVGISERHLSKIFDPYFSTKQKGSGLGLATTYSIIKQHDGHIHVYSEVNKGTVFQIYLPATEKACKADAMPETSEHKGCGRILIMDDQQQILKMAERIVHRLGYETAVAEEGARAVELYQNAYLSGTPFDLVILDLTVPGGMGGKKAIDELLKIDPNVKAVVSSGYSNDPVMADYDHYGFCGVVPKPYTKAQLSEVLNQVFGENG